MDERSAIDQFLQQRVIRAAAPLPQHARQRFSVAALHDGAPRFAVKDPQRPESSSAKPVRLFQDRVEHRREVARRGVDDPQHLGGCGLLLQGLARLGDQARILHRDHCLRRKVLQQRDLPVRKRPHLPAGDSEGSCQSIVFEQRDCEIAAGAAEFYWCGSPPIS